MACYLLMCAVMDVAFGQVLGVAIDTHLHRMLNQLGWVRSKQPEQTRRQLEAWLPRSEWPGMNLTWVGLGQELQLEKEKLLTKRVFSRGSAYC